MDSKQEHIINKSYLPALVLSASCIFIVGLLLTALFIHFELHRNLETHYSAVRVIIADIKDTLIIKTVKINGIFSLALLAGLSGLGIFFTHKVAGPLHRVKLSAKSIGEGSLGTKVNFRRKDVIHPFAESLNAMTDAYREKIEAVDYETDTLKEAAERLKVLIEEGKSTGDELQKLIEAHSRIKKVLDSIKT